MFLALKSLFFGFYAIDNCVSAFVSFVNFVVGTMLIEPISRLYHPCANVSRDEQIKKTGGSTNRCHPRSKNISLSILRHESIYQPLPFKKHTAATMLTFKQSEIAYP